MLDKIHIFISIIAAMAILIAGMIENLSLPKLTIRLIWVIIVFYIVGLIVRNYLKTKVFPELAIDDEENDLDEEHESEDTLDEEDDE